MNEAVCGDGIVAANDSGTGSMPGAVAGVKTRVPEASGRLLVSSRVTLEPSIAAISLVSSGNSAAGRPV